MSQVIPTEREETIVKLGLNPRLAHMVLFPHRHPDETPPFHLELIDLWHSESPRAGTEAFRGAAKSTLAEEAIAIMALYRKFKNGIIIGESEDRAKERLNAIKHEFETNEMIEELFGPMVGPTWQEKKIILSNGTVIQAFGRGQSLRGAKHLSERPDMVFGDDVEDDECVATPEAREKFKQWFMKVLIPALAPRAKFRIAGTPLDPEAWLLKLKASNDWVFKTFPIEHVSHETGERLATWPARFPLEAIDSLKKRFVEVGAAQEYAQEYMCEATDPASKTFTQDMVKVEPTVRTWHAVNAFFDPARTVKARSALTGWVAWSWINNRMIVWEGDGGLLKPDEIVDKIFEINDLYQPVYVGVEETGLNEFILQPLRHEQARRGITVPIKAMNAPKSKLDFIKGLQPYFKAKEVLFAKPLPELVQQMLSFPTGKIDTLNALAYAPRMRGGAAVFDQFTHLNVVEELPLTRDPVFLAINATAQFTTGVLVQFVKGGLHVTHDWVDEGDPGASLANIVRAAGLVAARRFSTIAGPTHFGTHDTVGLRAAARKVPMDISRGGVEFAGRETIRKLLRQQTNGQPSVRVASSARWALNGFSGGYCYPITKAGVLSDFTEPGAYRTLFEGLEAFSALMGSGITEDDTERNYAYNSNGKRFLTSLPR